MTKHHASVNAAFRESGWWAECACGWRSETFESPGLAFDAAAEHVAGDAASEDGSEG